MVIPNWWFEHLIDLDAEKDGFDYGVQSAIYEELSLEDVIAKYGDSEYVTWEGPWDREYALRSRNYDWFAILADVRNHAGYIPIAEPRGFPTDMSPDVTRWSKRLEHTPSWLTLQELLDVDWDGSTIAQSGFVSLEYFKDYVKNGMPSRWATSTVDPDYKIISNDEMAQIAVGCYGALDPTESYVTDVEWTRTYRDSVDASYLQKILDKLSEYGKPNEVRIVFYFDS